MAKSQDDFRPSDADEALRDPELADRPSGAGEPREAAQGPPNGGGLQQRVMQLEEELRQAQERVLRTQAELENFRRRMQREMQEERRYANQLLLLDLLPIIDNSERAISASEQSPECAGLLQGFQMLHQLLLSTLEKHGCRTVPAQGTHFDPTLHEAMMQAPSEQPAGTVIQVHRQGYQLHDRVIRPAQVVVSAGPPSGES